MPDTHDRHEPTAREIATKINLHSRECFLCIKPDYDVIDRGEKLICAAVQAETERCCKVISRKRVPKDLDQTGVDDFRDLFIAAIREGEK